MLSPAFRLTTTSSHSRAVSNDPSKKRPPNLTIAVFNSIIGGSCHKYHFCRNKSFVAKTKHVFCRKRLFFFFGHNKHVFVATSDKAFVATKMILVAAPAIDTTVLQSRQQPTIATGPCTIALEIKSSIKSMRMKETSHFCFEATSTLRSH